MNSLIKMTTKLFIKLNGNLKERKRKMMNKMKKLEAKYQKSHLKQNL
jgi:hypothetical protein